MTPEAPDGAFGHPLTEDYRPLSVHIQLPGALLTWAKRVSVCIACSFRSLWQGRRRRGSHSAIGTWVRPRHWPVSCVSKRPDSRNAKALAARVSSAGTTAAIEGVKRDELGLRDYPRGTSTETRLYVPTVSGNDLDLSDGRASVYPSVMVNARDLCENSGMYKHERSKAALSRMSDGEIMTPRQVSELLKIPESTLAVWRSTNRFVLPFFKLGHHVRYRRSDLEKFIAKNMRNAEAE